MDDVRKKLVSLRAIYGTKNPPEIQDLVDELQYLKGRRRKVVAHNGVEFSLPLILKKLQSLIDYLKSMRDVIGENVLLFMVDVFTTLYNIYSNCTWTSVTINLSSLFMRHFPKDLADYALNCFTALFEVIVAQSGAKDFLKSVFEMADEFLNDELWNKFSEFFLKVATIYASINKMVSFETIDVAQIVTKYKEFKKFIPDAKDLIETAFEAAEFVFAHWKEISSGDWTVLALGKDEAKTFETEVRLLENAFAFAITNQEVELKDRFDLTPSQFEKRLEKACHEAEKMARACTSVQQKMAISNFVRNLHEKRTNWYMRLADAPSHEEPYGMKISGPSSCGKSYLSKMFAKIIMQAYDLDPKQRGSTVFTNIMEKYESTVQPSHKIIVCDDVANNKNEKPNYDRVLNYVNTVPRPLEKAGVDEKGKKYPGNKGLIVTTNVKDLLAQRHSNCAESILRRFQLHVDVEIREQFQNSFGGLQKMETTRFDVYRLTLERFSHIDEETGDIMWETIPREEWVLDGSDDKDFAFLCKYLAIDIRRHRKSQKKQAIAQKEFDDAPFCPVCNTPKMVCLCSTLSSLEDFDSCSSISTAEDSKLLDCESFIEDIDSIVDTSIVEEPTETKQIVEAHFGDALAAMSTRTLWQLRDAMSGSREGLRDLSKNVLFWQQIYSQRRFLYKYISMILGAPFIQLFLGRNWAIFNIIFALCLLAQLYYTTLQRVERTLQQRLDYLSSVCERASDHVRTHILKYFSFGAAFYAIYNAYKVVAPLFRAEDKSSYLNKMLPVFDRIVNKPPQKFIVKTEDERDYKEGYSRLPPRQTRRSATTTADDLRKKMHTCQRVVLLKSKGNTVGTVNGLMVSGNVILIPSHIIPETDDFDIETTTCPNVPSAKTKDQKITRRMVYICPERDFALVHLPSAPPAESLLDYFPETQPTFRTKSTVLVYKSHDNDVYESRQAIRPYFDHRGKPSLSYVGLREKPGNFYGIGNYSTTFRIDDPFITELEHASFPGLCGSPYLDTERAIIYGFHVAGYSDGGKVAWLTSLTRPMIQKGLDQLNETSHSLVTHGAGEIKVNTYNLNYSIVDAPPLYKREDGLQDDAVVTYFGQVLKDGEPLKSRARAPYVPTPFEGVKEHLGECKHIPPTKPNDVAKAMKTLNKLHDPVQHYEHNLLEKAIEDYAQQTLECIEANKESLKDILRIYSQEEAMDGTHDGNLCGLPNATSAGFPIGKSKKHCLKRDPMDESLVQVPREFNDSFDVQAEIDRTLDAWANGERSEAIYKASSKVNELLPVKKALEKVRKFYGSPFANFIASRMALAGIPEFMRKYWRETECLVGVNPMSKDWDDLCDYLTEFGLDNMLAGDFSGFDTRMAAQITTGAAKVMLRWYKAVGVSDEDLMLIKGALSDIVNPNILFEGDLYRFANGNPSGNLITVQLNSICNSIMMRYVYYALNPKVSVRFNKNVKLATFGDDNAMGVKKNCGWFNHTACQAEFEKLAIGYTMADKDADSVPYLSLKDISFLKRNFRKHADLGCIVAPIEHDSITKKFHFVKKPNESPLSAAEQFGAYTDGSFREAYLHGEEYYNDFLNKIRAIVAKNPELKSHVSFIPYGEMTRVLISDYTEGYALKPRKIFADSLGVEEEDLDFIYEA
jgi:hypothetical protein